MKLSAIVFATLFFLNTAHALLSKYASGATSSECPSADLIFLYAPYDSRCSTHVAADNLGVWRWRYDFTLESLTNGAQVTLAPTLAGGIVSIKTKDAFEFVHSANHGTAFTLVIHPDTIDESVFKNEFVTPQNPSGFTECYNPTEEGSRLDDVRILALKKENQAQGHGISSSRVSEWEAGRAFDYEWFRSRTLFANYWPELLGFNSNSVYPCSPVPGEFTSGILSRFSSIKNVRLGKVKNKFGEYLAEGFSNFLVIDRIIFIEKEEPKHKRIAGTEVLYLANDSKTREDIFTEVCVIENSNDCKDQAGAAVAWNIKQPVIVSDKTGEHAIGTISAEPSWVNKPKEEADLKFLNIHAAKNSDAWKNRVLQQNWIIEGKGGAWISQAGADGQALAFRTRMYYAVGSKDEVLKAMLALRDQVEK